MKSPTTRVITASCALAALFCAAPLSAQFPFHFGSACGGASVEQTGDARPGGTIDLAITQLPSQSLVSAMMMGTNRYASPIPLASFGLGSCDLLVDAFATLSFASTGSANVLINIPSTWSLNVDLHFQVLSLLPSTILGSDGLTVPIDATPPTITALSATTAANLTPMTITGQFDRDFQHHCVATPSGVAIITGGNQNQLTVEVQAVGATVTGPVMILEGRRDQIPASSFVPLPGAPAPQSMVVFTGTPAPSTMGTSQQTITVQQTPGFRPLGSSASSASTIRYSFAGGCTQNDCLRVWMRIYENGRCHDIYFTENGAWAGKSLRIPSNMSGNLCANWACAWLIQSLGSRIPGFQCNVVGDAIEMSVQNGTGITNFEGGFWISLGPC